jgi:hypothetical protein
MKRSVQIIPLFLLLTLPLWGQDVILTNPSVCDSTSANRLIKDFTCPENSGFYQPNRFKIQVRNAPGTVLGQDVFLKEVRLLIRHPWAADLRIRLISPGGKTVLLSENNGGGQDNYGEPSRPNCGGYMTFSAASCFSIKTAEAPFTSAPSRSEEPLLNFNDNTTNPNGDWTLLICDDTEQDTGRLDFVQLIFEPLACLPVQEITILSQDTTGVAFSWSPSNACAQTTTIIEYGPFGFTPGTGASNGQGRIAIANCPPYNLTGLQPDTQYEIYIRKACSTGGFSGNSCPLSFRTGCLPPRPLTLETFDQETICDPVCNTPCKPGGFWRNDPQASFNWIVYKDPTPTQGTGPDVDVSGGGNYVYIETTGFQCAVGSKAMLNSGCFQLNKQNSDACHLSFYYHMYGPTTGSLRLEVSINGGITWTSLWEKRGDQGNKWNKQYVSLGAYQNGTVMQFRFIATKGSGSAGDIGLDQIAVNGSAYLGFPDTRYYVDADLDGFGTPNSYILSCANQTPTGYSRIGTDCNDANPAINPNAPEIPCDNIDNNCNGLADDTVLPPPLASGDTICSGETVQLRATPIRGDVILWYTSPSGGTGAFGGNPYSPVLPVNNGTSPVIYRFYAEAVDNRQRCFSATRTEVLVVVNPLPKPVLVQAPAVCPGESIDLARINISDQNFTSATLSFHQSLPATTANKLNNTVVQPTATTLFYYKMTSAQGCSVAGDGAIQIRQRPSIQITPSRSIFLCLESSQSVGATPSGGAGSYRYLWSTGEETSSIRLKTGSVVGQKTTYRLTLTDGSGCTNKDSLILTTTNNIDSVRRSITNVSSCNGKDGSIRVEPLNGSSPFRYRWSGSNGTQGDTTVASGRILLLSKLAQGAYSFTITDNSSQGCQFILRNAYVNGPGAELRSVQTSNVTCRGSVNGSIALDVKGTARFRWNTNDTTATISNLRGGTYAVTITSGICQNIISNIVVAEPDSIKVIASLRTPLCSTSQDGTISVSVFGGAGNYKYQWSTGSPQTNIDRLSKGGYQLTITDGAGCQVARLFELGAPPALVINLDSLQAISCFGQRDGRLRVSGQGGTGPYQFLWNQGSNNPVQRNLSAGNYTVTLTDNNLCQVSRTVTLIAPNRLQTQIVNATVPRCFGDTSGRLSATATGGTLPYRFLWNTGKTSSEIRSLGVGAYWVLTADRNNCLSDTVRVRLDAQSRIELLASIVPPTCTGRSDGVITVQGRGNGPFRYRWERGDTTNFILDAAPGAQKISIRDGRGCIFDTTFLLSVATRPLVAEILTLPPRCKNDQDGIINVRITKTDNPPLAFRWSDGASTENRENLKDGLYGLTVTDRLGCQLIKDSLRLESPPVLRYDTVGFGQVLCKGDSTGFVELAVSGGKKPYSYNWIGTKSTTNAAYRLKVGEYRVFIQDANGCPINASFKINEPAKLLATINAKIGNPCEGDTTNQLTAVASGGVLPYAYQWNFGPSQTQLSNLPPGDFQVSVKDANGCKAISPSVKIRDAGNVLRLVSFTTRDISCFGKKDGEATAQIRGGQGPYQYQFANYSTTVLTSQTTIKIKGLPADNAHQVVVSDARGCRVLSQQRSIREPFLLKLRRDSVRNVRCFGDNTGGAYVTITGGTPPFAYNWYDNTTKKQVAVTEDLQSFRSGTYFGVVTDARLCTDTISSVLINSNAPIQLISSAVTNIQCKGSTTGSITVNIQGGRTPYRYEWNNRVGGRIYSNLAAGNYQLRVIDADSCRVLLPSFKITEPDQKLVVKDTVSNISCNNVKDGSIRVGISGGLPPYRWDWQDTRGNVFGLDAFRVSNLGAGLFTLSLSDANNCNQSYSYLLNQPSALKFEFEVARPSRSATSDGSIKVLPTGGTPAYRYLWNNLATTQQVTGLTKGKYVVTVTDSKNCRLADSIQLLSVAVQDFPIVEKVVLYPNPSSTESRLDVTLKQATPLQLLVYNGVGQLVFQQAMPLGLNPQLSLPVQLWPPGTYMVRLTDSDRIVYAAQLLVTR